VKALIFVISGQDGTYFSKFILDKGYKIFATSRNVKKNNFN
jgi:GDPmannose 4,6-dehydratase